ncbi:hypothetical protein [Helicobacter sp. T3_23-1056]
MALPLIPIGIGLVAGASAIFGAKKAYDAYQDSERAEYWHEQAKEEYESSEKELKKHKNEAEQKFAELGEYKKLVIEETFPRYLNLIDKLKIEKQKDLGEFLKDFDLTKFKEAKQNLIDLQKALGGLVGGGLAGAVAGFGAYGAVGLLATASTGTAISSLSGIAATNATLAWLGGGATAIGGLGVAGGTAVLGGIVAAPVIAVAALVWAKSAESKKYDAMSYHTAVEAVCASLEVEKLLWVQIYDRAQETKASLVKIEQAFGEAMYLVENLIDKKGDEVHQWDKDEQKSVTDMIQLAGTTQAIINAPILFDNDPTTKKIIAAQKETKKLMDELQKKFG